MALAIHRRSSTRRLWVGLVGLLPACAGAKIAGGHVVFRGEEPRGTVVATYDGVACSDARGGAVSGPDRSIEVVRLESGREVLVARRAGYDDLIVDNVSSKDRSRVFQVATKSDDGRPFLRTYRIPLSGGPASLDVTDEFLDERETAGGFRARPGRSLLRCRLTESSAHSRSVVGSE